jgi:hypothetical protein
VREGKLGRPVRITDLETNTCESQATLGILNIGEYIFWRCLEEVLGTTPEVLREAYLVMIHEPGKARTVTKAHAALKVVLDLVNGICSYPLQKVESSESGMSKSNHGWNFFTNLYDQWRSESFHVSETETQEEGGNTKLRTNVFSDLLIGFTDYSEATDNMEHKIASCVSEAWMLKCGLPSVLRGIVHETCYKPRTIFFAATGPMKKIGTPVPEVDNRNQVTLVRGVLMGDPLTKVVLHLMNMVTRELGKLGTEQSVTNTIPYDGPVSHRIAMARYRE